MSEPDSADPHTDTSPSGNRDEFYLTHMLECINSILRYSASGSVDSDELTQDAVLRKLQLRTESSKRISAACKAGHPEIPWRELAGFRNVVVHDYLGIQVGRILSIVAKDTPVLKEQIEAILAAISGTQTMYAARLNQPLRTRFSRRDGVTDRSGAWPRFIRRARVASAPSIRNMFRGVSRRSRFSSDRVSSHKNLSLIRKNLTSQLNSAVLSLL